MSSRLSSGSGASSGALVKLDEISVGAGGQAALPFSAIDQRYRHLALIVHGRSDAAATFCNILLQFNGDGGANYDWDQLWASASVGVSPSAANTSIVVGQMVAATGPASAGDYSDILVPNYASAAQQKSVRALWSQKSGTTSGTLGQSVLSGWWRSTAPVTSIRLAPSTGNFAQNTLASLYGLS